MAETVRAGRGVHALVVSPPRRPMGREPAGCVGRVTGRASRVSGSAEARAPRPCRPGRRLPTGMGEARSGGGPMSITRRDFLIRTVAGAAGGVAGAALPGCVPEASPAPIVDVPAPVGGRLSIVVARYPQLASPGGAV